MQVAGDLVERLGLEAHVDQLVATYSGGTRRKLSTALALLGSPDLLLLVSPGDGGPRPLGAATWDAAELMEPPGRRARLHCWFPELRNFLLEMTVPEQNPKMH